MIHTYPFCRDDYTCITILRVDSVRKHHSALYESLPEVKDDSHDNCITIFGDPFYCVIHKYPFCRDDYTCITILRVDSVRKHHSALYESLPEVKDDSHDNCITIFGDPFYCVIHKYPFCRDDYTCITILRVDNVRKHHSALYESLPEVKDDSHDNCITIFWDPFYCVIHKYPFCRDDYTCITILRVDSVRKHHSALYESLPEVKDNLHDNCITIFWDPFYCVIHKYPFCRDDYTCITILRVDSVRKHHSALYESLPEVKDDSHDNCITIFWDPFYCVIHKYPSCRDDYTCITILRVDSVRKHHSALYESLPGPRLNIKTVLSTYGDFHVKDKTAVRTSYL